MARTIAIIPVKGRSVGLPGKNVRHLAGKQLFRWTLEQALACKELDEVYVSSDAQMIRDVALVEGALAIDRPAALCQDDTSTEAVIEHALSLMEVEPERVVLLQATSPVRVPKDISNAIFLLNKGYDSVVSVVPSHSFLWYISPGRPLAVSYDPLKRPMRQEMAGQFEENGSIYAFTVSGFQQRKCRIFGSVCLYQMPDESRIQIDSELDFQLVEAIMQRRLAGVGQ